MKQYVVHIAIGMGIAVVALSCAGHSSGPKPTAAETTMTEKGEVGPVTEGFEGTIGRIDIDNGMMTVEHWPLSKTFKVPAECHIEILTNAAADLAQLKVGDAVVVTFAGSGKDLVANRIIRKGKAYNEEQNEKMERLDEMLNPSPNQ
jgi:hypothetical protein